MFIKDLPEKEELLSWYGANRTNKVLNVNGHFHTPYSFSAFSETAQVFELATKENVTVLGINDFFTTEGYEEFNALSAQHKTFPLFNIEFMGLQKDLQDAGVRVNDPSNPGRTYFSGKGLAYPTILKGKEAEMLTSVFDESLKQTKEMVALADKHVKEVGLGIELSFEDIKTKYAKELVRERHIAKAIRIALFEKYTTDEERTEAFTKLYSGKTPGVSISDEAALENEIRGALLKTGGKAFVEEDPKAFLSLEEIRDIIIAAGGLPCYPLLLDDANGNYTDFEEDKEKLHDTLVSKGIYSIELIPGRNSLEALEELVDYFVEKKFVVTFGTEHNTPEMIPLTVDCRGGVDLSDSMKIVNYEGASIVAAHQYLIAKGEEGYLFADGSPKMDEQEAFIKLGKAVIAKYIA